MIKTPHVQLPQPSYVERVNSFIRAPISQETYHRLLSLKGELGELYLPEDSLESKGREFLQIELDNYISQCTEIIK